MEGGGDEKAPSPLFHFRLQSTRAGLKKLSTDSRLFIHCYSLKLVK